MEGFLPTTKQEMKSMGIDRLDFILITADAYVDHPSFAHAVVSRYLVAHGYTVGIIAQPNWKNTDDFRRLKEPKLGFLISGGNMDSMVNLFTSSKKRRAKDLYSPGGKTTYRPERATIVYAKKVREVYGNVPIIIGGIEASLRRFAHYDYWDNKVMPSILADSKADILVYGMGERALVQIAQGLEGGLAVKDITYVNGTMYRAENLERVYEYKEIASEAAVMKDKNAFADAFVVQMHERNKVLCQKSKREYVVQNPPEEPLLQEEMDFIYSLPYKRAPHPKYTLPIPAFSEVKYSISATRGCVGGCAFCALYYHQGKNITYRSEKSILEEANIFLQEKGFKGYIHDVGGPTANFYGLKCTNKNGMCNKRRCLTPTPCKFLRENHGEYLSVLKKLREIPGIKKVFIRSGIRFDYALMDKSGRFIRELAKNHVSGQLKLAPEHVSDNVLACMGKPNMKVYERFCEIFNRESAKTGKKQYILPYFMSSHPGCEIKDAVRLAQYVKENGFAPEQAQDFYPTPGTLASCMYYTQKDPYTKKDIYVPRDKHEKEMQRALIQYNKRENYNLVKKALVLAGREDLIGDGKRTLIRAPETSEKSSHTRKNNAHTRKKSAHSRKKR